MTPTLSIYTPTFRRPAALEQCEASVAAQTVPVEHVIVRDEVGLGVAGMFADIANHAHEPSGDYVMVLSDDNVLADTHAVEEMAVELAEDPDVLMFKGDILGTIQPAAWREEPQITKVDLSCYAVRRDLWAVYALAWGHRYEGDFDFIRALWNDGWRFQWWDRLVFRALRISRGAPE